MASTGDSLATAIQHHQAGDLPSAERVYRAILAAEPRHADALHLLGLIALQVGQHLQAGDLIRRAIAVNPNAAAFHSNLGTALMEQGQAREAIACYRRAVALKPDYAEAYSNLGAALRDQGELDEAITSCEQALRYNSNYAEAHYNLGITQHSQGRIDEAIASCQRALQLRPNYDSAHYILGVALRDQGKLDAAIAHLQCLLQLKPDHIDAHDQLAIALRTQGKLAEAIALCERALELEPDCAEAHNTVGTVLQIQGRLDEATLAYQRALRISPDFSEAHNNLGVALLSAADFENGWEEYEWRWQTTKYVERDFGQPIWDGTRLEGRTILVYAEQGFGDTIQFARYLSLVKQQGGEVLLECQEPLRRLLACLAGPDGLVARGADTPDFDVRIPLLSLPRVFKTTLETIPANVPYLSAEPELVENWRIRLDGCDGLKVGIFWQGNPGFSHDLFRSIPVYHFTPLAQVPDVRLISLQKGHGVEQLQALEDPPPVIDLSAELHDFVDTAAVMMNLDLLVTSDSAVAHLAGALGVPVWLATQYAPDWRWLQDREDSPWYPTMRLFRQSEFGDWQGVFERIAMALRSLSARDTEATSIARRGSADPAVGPAAGPGKSLRRMIHHFVGRNEQMQGLPELRSLFANRSFCAAQDSI